MGCGARLYLKATHLDPPLVRLQFWYMSGSAMTLLKHEVEQISDNFSCDRVIEREGYKGTFRHTQVAVKLLSKVRLLYT